ncbi:hypothetical protein [Bremerella sp. P1]|uniref:hypothetical protein n=1 Tax=Bremerella sp. P1 TaxID=3026424 RepID=UPI002368D32C|nr:hypothetical protein [Bremerella sp. P1]WDI41260.1 hypothetical protein PSR63_22600 [Bremerella sp. P1]
MDFGKSALLIAHPAHELLLYGWMAEAKPTVYCLTTGAAYGQTARIGRTESIIEQTQSSLGKIFGRYDDQALYALLLEGRTAPLVDLTWELADALVEDEVETVVGDAAEGQILVHDVWRAIIDGAVRFAAGHYGHRLLNLEFAIETLPNHVRDSRDMVLSLDRQRIVQKEKAICRYVEIQPEVDRLKGRYGSNLIRQEVVRSASSASHWLVHQDKATRYEQLARRQVKEGRYQVAMSFDQHVFPLLKELEAECRLANCP